ncbi:hypothetical protein AVEN_148926-1 [Araneus ventricosus]|uniref:Uncharacterized protein n=1 Tax=Araneus ventricosus TaxID=182803 RepID=A0A4Y2DIB5_ARAVE|nr:hypothetical protein AVEN_148926-1 [Araneus ventricosus]
MFVTNFVALGSGICCVKFQHTFSFVISREVDIFDDQLVCCDYQLILYFSNPVDFKGAGIGRTQKEWFGAEPPYAGIVQPLERCSEMASYNQEKRAVNFGDELFSHAKVPIGRKDFVHDFNVTFDLRTYYPNGLIALVKNGHISPVSHFAIMLLGGRAVINLYDRKARRVSNPSYLNDGNWHHISWFLCFPLKAKVYSEFSVVSTDYASNLDPIQHPSMADTSNSVYMRCGKPVNELVMRLGALQYEEIIITISNADKSKKMPQNNPFSSSRFYKDIDQSSSTN